MPEKNYSKREQDEYRANMLNRMDKQDTMLDKIYDQTSKTNGRVTKLEERTSDYSQLKTLVENFKDWKIEFVSNIHGATKVIVAVAIAVPVIFGTLFTLYIEHLESGLVKDTSASVISTLQSEYNLKIVQP